MVSKEKTALMKAYDVIGTKGYNALLATVQLGLDVDESGIAPSAERDLVYAHLKADHAAGKVYWPLTD